MRNCEACGRVTTARLDGRLLCWSCRARAGFKPSEGTPDRTPSAMCPRCGDMGNVESVTEMVTELRRAVLWISVRDDLGDPLRAFSQVTDPRSVLARQLLLAAAGPETLLAQIVIGLSHAPHGQGSPASRLDGLHYCPNDQVIFYPKANQAAPLEKAAEYIFQFRSRRTIGAEGGN